MKVPEMRQRKASFAKRMSKSLPVLPASPLPPLYAAWMNEALAGPISPEREATCDHCAMLADAGETVNGSATFFNPQTKCCTYLPDLPNFLVGRALADKTASTGRATVAARLRAGIAVTPFGLGVARKYSLLYAHSTNSFGHSQSLRCPHYLAEEGGNCGVWRHRNAICATWFCKHERGARGDQFWHALLQLLAHVEQHLAHWCVLELDVGEAALRRLFQPLGKGGQSPLLNGDELDEKVNAEQYRALWGNWHGREEEFYQQCAKLVEGLCWADVLAHCGPETRAFLQLARAAQAELLADSLPAKLTVGTMQLAAVKGNRFRAVTYSPYDPLDLSAQLLGALGHFDGRPTAEARQRLAEQEQLALNDALLHRLVDFGILVSADNMPEAV